jgi:hypothetical protein
MILLQPALAKAWHCTNRASVMHWSLRGGHGSQTADGGAGTGGVGDGAGSTGDESPQEKRNGQDSWIRSFLQPFRTNRLQRAKFLAFIQLAERAGHLPPFTLLATETITSMTTTKVSHQPGMVVFVSLTRPARRTRSPCTSVAQTQLDGFAFRWQSIDIQ